MTIVRLWAYAHAQPPRGVWGHASPENFGNFNTLRAFLMHSGSSFWTDLVAISISFANTQNYVAVILEYVHVIKWGGGGGGGGGGLKPPCPPISPPLHIDNRYYSAL